MNSNNKQIAQEQMWTVEQLEPKLLLSADLMPGIHEITGNIEKPGEQKQYEFVVTEKTKIFFDGVDGAKFNWSLKGKEFGQNFSTTQLEQDSHNFIDLVPDTYQLTVDGEDDQTGNYTFRMLGESAAITLNVNEQTELKLNPSSQAVLYKVQLNQGDRVFFESQTSNATWSIFDPNAQLVKNRLNTAEGFEATKTGTYWLSIEGNDSQDSLESQFILHASKPEVIALNLNDKTTVSFNKPYQSIQYTFNLEHNQWIGFDQLTTGLENTEWLIKDSVGNIIFSNKTTNQKDTDTAPQFLNTGAYVLFINSLSTVQGEISFKLKSSTQVDAVIDENNKSLIFNNGNESRFVKINAENSNLLGLISDFYATNISNTKYLNLEGISEKIIGAGFSEQGVELYELVLNKNDKIYLEKNREDALIRIFNEKGEEIAKSESNDLDFSALKGGVYYIGISSNLNKNYNINDAAENSKTENVAIKIKYIESAPVNYTYADVGGSIYTAKQLDFIRTKQLQVTIGDNNSNYADADFYRIQVKSGDKLNVSTPNGNGFDGYLKVFDKYGNFITSTDDYPLSYIFNQGGEYYLAFSAYGNSSYSPYDENSGGYAGSKGVLNVNIELNAADSPKVYLLDQYGNIVLDTTISQAGLLQQKLNENEEYYIWINSSLSNASYYSYTLGLSNKTTQQVELQENTKLEFNFNGVINTQEVELSVTEAGTYFIYPETNLLNASWVLNGPGINNLKWDNEFFEGETSTQAVYLTTGKYQLSISNYDLNGDFGIKIIAAKTLEKIISDQNYTIDTLSPGESTVFAIDSSYLDEYTFNLNTTHPDLSISVWDQYGQLLAKNLTDGTNVYQDYKQNKIYISVVNESLYESIQDITLKYQKNQYLHPVNVVKSITLNENVIQQAKDLPRNINYSLALEQDSFVSFEFVQNIYEEVVIIGPAGEIISADALKVTGQWLIAGQYFIEFKNKIKNNVFEFNIRDINQYSKLNANVSTHIDLNNSNGIQIYHFNMDANSEYYLKFDNNFSTAKFKVLSQDGFEIVSGNVSSEKIYLPKTEWINDYILIIESNGDSSPLDLNLVEVAKVINMTVTDAIDYSFMMPYQTQEIELQVSQAGLYYFDYSYLNGVWLEIITNDQQSNGSLSEAYATVEQNQLNNYENSSHQIQSYYLSQGTHKLILHSQWSADAALLLKIKAATDIVELNQIDPEWSIPAIEAYGTAWFKMPYSAYADLQFKLKTEQTDLSVTVFDDYGYSYEDFYDLAYPFSLNKEADYIYLAIHNYTSEAIQDVVFETKNKNLGINLNQKQQFNYDDLSNEPVFLFEVAENGWVTLEFDNRYYGELSISNESDWIFYGWPEYVNYQSQTAFQTIYLQAGTYKLEFWGGSEYSRSNLLTESDGEILEEENVFQFTLHANTQLSQLEVNQVVELDLQSNFGYQTYSVHLADVKDYQLQLLTETAGAYFRLYTSDGIEWNSGYLSSESLELQKLYGQEEYILVIWNEQQELLQNLSITLEEKDSTTAAIPVIATVSVGVNATVSVNEQITADLEHQVVTLNIQQDGIYFISQEQGADVLSWSLTGPSLYYDNNDRVSSLYLRQGVYHLIINNAERLETAYQFNIIPVSQIHNQVIKNNDVLLDSLAVNETVFYKLAMDANDELLFKGGSQFAGIQLNLWTEDGYLIDSYNNLTQEFPIYSYSDQPITLYLTISNISANLIENINFIIKDKITQLDLNSENHIPVADLYYGMYFNFNVEQANLYGLDIDSPAEYSFDLYKVTNEGWNYVSRSVYIRDGLYFLEAGQYAIRFDFWGLPVIGDDLIINFEQSGELSLGNPNLIEDKHFQIYELNTEDDFNYFIDIEDLNHQESADLRFIFLDENGNYITDRYYYSTLMLPFSESGKKYWLIIENYNQIEAELSILKIPKQLQLSVSPDERTTLELDFIAEYQEQEVVLNIENSGVYFLEFSNFDSLQWQLVGPGLDGEWFSTESMLTRGVEFANNTGLSSVYLTAGTYRLALNSQWQIGHAAFNVIPAAQAVNLLTNVDTTIDQLAAGESKLYRVYQDYFAVYTENYNQFIFSLISEHYDVQFDFWTQDGERIYPDYNDENQIVELIKTQPYFYISVKNTGFDVQENIQFKVVKENKVTESVVSEAINLNQTVTVTETELNDQLAFEFSTATDGFIRFDFAESAYQYLKITGSDGFVFEGTPRTLNTTTGQALEAFWLKSGQYKVELSNKLAGKNLQFVIQNQSEIANIGAGETAVTTLNANGGYQFFNLQLDSNAEYWLRHYSSAQNLSALRYTLYSQDGKKLSNDSLWSLYQSLPAQGLSNQYIILVENSSNIQIEYRFDLIAKEILKPKAIELNQIVNDQFIGLNQQQTYTFTLAQLTALKLEQLSLTSASNSYQIKNSKGQIVNPNYGLYMLAADTYTLTVSNTNNPNDTANLFSFKTTTVSQLVDLNLNTQTTVVLSGGVSDKLFKVYLDKDKLYDLSKSYYSYDGLIIYSESGVAVQSVTPNSYSYGTGFLVNQTGYYYIQAINYGYNNYTGNISFTINVKLIFPV